VLFYYRNTGEIWSSAAQFRAFGGAFTWDYNTYRAPYPYRKLTMSAGQDGCRFNENVRRSADATFEGDPTGLPIVDIRLTDIGGSTEQFGFTFGNAYFR